VAVSVLSLPPPPHAHVPASKRERVGKISPSVSAGHLMQHATLHISKCAHDLAQVLCVWGGRGQRCVCMNAKCAYNLCTQGVRNMCTQGVCNVCTQGVPIGEYVGN